MCSSDLSIVMICFIGPLKRYEFEQKSRREQKAETAKIVNTAETATIGGEAIKSYNGESHETPAAEEQDVGINVSANEAANKRYQQK